MIFSVIINRSVRLIHPKLVWAGVILCTGIVCGKYILQPNFRKVNFRNLCIFVVIFSFCRESVQAIDYGLDFYAPQTLLSPDGRRIMIGWMQNWDTCIPPAGAKYFAQMSVPRELSLKEGRLMQNPVKELETLRKNKVEHML